MDTTKIKRQLVRCDHDQLSEIIRYCEKRKDKLLRDELEKKADEAWERAKQWTAGQTVYCCKSGYSLDPNGWQRGDKGTVQVIKPRARKWKIAILSERDNKTWWFAPRGLNQENFQTEPPDNPCSEDERARWGKFGNVINKALNEA